MPRIFATGPNVGKYEGEIITLTDNSFADKSKIELLATRSASGAYAIFKKGDAFPTLTQLKPGDGYLLFANAEFTLPGLRVEVVTATVDGEQGPIAYDEPILTFAGEPFVIAPPVFSQGGGNATAKYSIDGGNTFATYDVINAQVAAKPATEVIQLLFRTDKTAPFPATSCLNVITKL